MKKIILTILILALPALVWAGEYILYPDSAGTYQNWSTGGSGSYHWDRVDDPWGYHDSDTSYLSAAYDLWTYETEKLQNPTAIPDGDIIDSVDAILKARCTVCTGELQSGAFYIVWWNGTTLIESVVKNPFSGYPAQTTTTFHDKRTTALDDLAWTKAKLNNLQVGLFLDEGNLYPIRVTAINVHVYTTTPSTAIKSHTITKDIEDAQGILEGGVVR